MKSKNQKTPISSASRLPVFDSMQACEAATGIPKGLQQQAKRDGCEAFDSHGRVRLGELLRFLFAKGEDGEESANWPDRLKRAQALKAEHELSILQGEYVERTKVRADMTAAASKAVAVLTQKFETELPAKQDGMPAAEIAKLNRAAIREVRIILSQPETYQ
jgi:hypothetical protein